MHSANKIFPKIPAVLSLLIFSAALFFGLQARGAFVTPTQVSIEDGQRAFQVVVSNQGPAPKMISMEWERRAMKEGGQLVKLQEGEAVEGYRPADPYLRFSPRRTILRPRESQKIRIIARRPSDMKQGEYHSHLLIKEDDVPMRGKKEPEPSPGKISGQLSVKVYTSIPVFLRHGETKIDMTLEKAALEKKQGKTFLNVTVSNRSTRSLYPQLKLICIPRSGEPAQKTLAAMRIYTEVRSVENSYPLRDFDISRCARLKAQLAGANDFEVNGKILSEKDVRR